MDKTTWIGVILGIIAVVLGMFLKGVGLGVLVNPAAVMIIIVGTVASVLIAFPVSEVKRIPKIMSVIFKERETLPMSQIISQFADWAQLARKEGLLSLEVRINEINDPFLKNGLSLAVDGQSADYIRDVLNEEIDAMEERHQSAAQIFSQAGTYAPSLGVLGAVIGLIAALGNMSDINALGEAISAAFVATMLGIFTGYVLWHPFANKLKRKSKIEAKHKRMMIEGILSILEGESPRVIEQKLSSYLPGKERKEFLDEGSKES
ncbi:flagellar motor stator protein MotA [Cytobacillus sp. FSL W7-1323]|uniref:Flagellar motor protein MotA n=1 Tax=Cytobacillus kochii TaxID=859143 RepID=A0A248TEC2_9BACI|nr:MULTISPECIES: flagellar motor stator protein MotA [Cytobacillus]ASV66513.1 flagellar motor protein MotA [Cytobacillus kochii]MDQ0188083.1 chemotaxis protein MotA [Cytobacillus kochii]MEA1854356.1 flagellar motor stator protein MotA [Cytobacillus sp. OWB-43]MED1607024.1 flagellar motor stator protein MotA [Cytobacillus kochii]